jgi:hypothetical protein
MAAFLESDLCVLQALAAWQAHQRQLEIDYEWARPMDCGGHGASGHSQSLARMCKLGLVERRQRTDSGNYLQRSRPSFEYRMTRMGVMKLEEMRTSGGCQISLN